MIGWPVTCRTDSAAPPRASPSSLVRTTPVKPTPSWKAVAGGDGVLADHRVDDEQRLVGLDGVADAGGLRHQLRVDAEAAGGVDDDDVVHGAAGVLDRVRGDLDRVADAVARLGRVDVDAGLAGHDRQLLDGVGALQVGGDEQRGVALRLQPAAELAGEGRLTGALQAGQHDHRRRLLGEPDAGGSRRRGCR